MNLPTVRCVASTYSFLWRCDLAAAIDELAATGFASVEILAAMPHAPLPMDTAAARRLRRACEASGVDVNSVVPSGVDVNLASVDQAMRHWSVEQFVAAARLAAELGAECVIVHPGRRHPLRPPPLDTLRDWVIDGLTSVVTRATAEGVRVLLENTPTGLFDTGKECTELADQVGSDQLGICYDVANGHMVEDVADGLPHVASGLGLVHVSDTTRSAWAHDPIGDGDVPFPEIWRALIDQNYTGSVVIETLQPDGASQSFVRDVARLRAAGWRLH